MFLIVEKVLTVREGKAMETSITTGQRTSDWTEVVAGVESGDVVIVEPGNLRSGQLVSVVQ